MPVVSVNVAGLTDLAAKLRAVNAELEEHLQAKLVEAGDIVATAARARAPGSVGGDIVTEPAGPGLVRVRGVGTKAIVIENAGKGFVRHPLFGIRTHWYNNPNPAYLHPALLETEGEVYETVVSALYEAWEAAMGE